MGMIENGRSSADNLKEISWVKENTKKELEAVKSEVTSLDWKEWFYSIDTNTGEVVYDMQAVKDYLTWLKDRPYAGTKITANSTPWIVAVQIALESLNKPGYDTGKIDGILWRETRDAVRKFQEDSGFTWKDLDGLPGPKTISKLLEALEWWPTLSVTPKTWVEVVTWGSLNPEDLLDNLQTGMVATFDGTPDFTTIGTQTINVKVVDATWAEITGSPFACSYEVVDVPAVTPKTWVKVTAWDYPPAETFLENVPSWATVTYKDTPDFSTPGAHQLSVTVLYEDFTTQDFDDIDYEVEAPSPTPKYGLKIKKWETKNAEDLLNDVPSWATVTYKDTPDFTTPWSHTVEVTVTYPDWRTEDISVTYEVVDYSPAVPKVGMEVLKWTTPSPRDFFDSIPTDAVAQFKTLPDFNTIWYRTVTIWVKYNGWDEEDFMIMYEVIQ